MFTDFSEQTVIVTGGTRGIGAAVSTAFLNAGAKVVATYAGNDERAAAFRAAQGEKAGNLFCEKFDVADYAAVEAFYKAFPDKYGPLQVLVNNAGIRRDSVLAMMPEADWRRVIDANLTGTFNMSKFAVQLMMTERYGRIVCVTSPSGRIGIEGQANYAASKAGQVALARSLSKETAKRGITVNCVSPGYIDTELLSDLPPELAKEYKQSVPLKRFGKPEEVAAAVLFLACREASYVTGSTLEVTGGLP